MNINQLFKKPQTGYKNILFKGGMLLLAIVLAFMVNNCHGISEDKKEVKIAKLKQKLIRTKEKRAYQRSQLAKLKANEEIFKAIQKNKLNLEDSKETPILLIDSIDRNPKN